MLIASSSTGEAWEFVVEVAGKAWRFILDTVEAISKGLSWIWNNLIKKPFKDLINWLGLELARHWKDICATKGLIKGMLKGCINYGIKGLGGMADSVDATVDEIEKVIHTSLEKDMKTIEKPNADGKDVVKKARSKEPSAVDTALEWIRDALSNAAKKKSQVSEARDKTRQKRKDKQTPIAELGQATAGSVADLFGNVLGNISTTAMQIIEKILSLFASDAKLENFSATDVIRLIHQVFADIVVGLLRTVGGVVGDALRIVETAAAEILSVLDTPVDVLLFGPLLKKLIPELPSLLDLVCFVIAIPATLIRKMMSSLIGAQKDQKDIVRKLPPSVSEKEIEDLFSGELGRERPILAGLLAETWYTIQVAVAPVLAIVDLGLIGYAAVTAGNGLLGAAPLRKVAGGGVLIARLLGALALFPFDPKNPGLEARLTVSANPIYFFRGTSSLR